MRVVLVLSILVLILFVYSIPESFATFYENPVFEFSVDYPEGWDYVDDLVIQGKITYPVTFYDDENEWYSMLDIRFVDGEFGGKFGTDKNNLESLGNNLSGWCDVATFEIDGFTCSDFYIEYLRTVPEAEYKAYEMKYSWIMITPDDMYYDYIVIVRYIPGETGAWYLYSETIRDRFPDYENLIYDSFDSFYAKDVEVLGQNNLESLLDDSGNFVNEQYGFSIVPPSNWELGNTNFSLGGARTPASFVNPVFQGLAPPSVFVLYTQTVPYDLEAVSPNEFLDEFENAWMKKENPSASYDVTYDNFEKFEGRAKITVRTDMMLNPLGSSTPMRMEIVGWHYENGKFYGVVFIADPIDFDQNYPAYRKAFNTLSIPKLDLDSKIDTTLIPKWVKNNAGWWAEDLIGDSDFVKGLEYLINNGSIKVENSESTGTSSKEIPSWIKTNASWWAAGQISDADFLKGIEFLIKDGIIQVDMPELSQKDNL